MKTLNIFYLIIYWTLYGTAAHHGRYGLLIRDSSPDVPLFHSVTQRFSFTMASTAAMPSGVTTGCAWPGRGESVTELLPFMNFLVHSYTCCSDRHASPYWTSICRWISMGFNPYGTLFFFGACCKRGRQFYTTTAPSCSIPASYCQLSATLQTISITVAPYNRAVFRIFIALLRFSFDSPSYIYHVSATCFAVPHTFIREKSCAPYSKPPPC